MGARKEEPEDCSLREAHGSPMTEGSTPGAQPGWDTLSPGMKMGRLTGCSLEGMCGPAPGARISVTEGLVSGKFGEDFTSEGAQPAQKWEEN